MAQETEAPTPPALDLQLDEPGTRTGILRLMGRWQIVLLAKLIEFAVIFCVAMVVCAGNDHLSAQTAPRYIAGSLTVAAACYVSVLNAGLYDINRLIDFPRVMKQLSINWTVVFAGVAAVMALAHHPDLYSRLWFLEFYAGGLVALGFERWSVERLVRAWVAHGHFTKSVAIVGANELAVALLGRLRRNRNGIRVIGVFDDRTGDAAGRISPLHRHGAVADLLDYGKTNAVDLVVVTLPIAASDRIQQVIKTLREQPFKIRILPGMIGLQILSPISLQRSELPGVQLIAVMDRPISEFALFIKSALDRLLAAFLLVLLLPILTLCAAGIIASDGFPVLFRQERVGYKGRIFKIYKFRTMRAAPLDPYSTKRNDPRVFPFGGLLRRSSLDELPQLLNVLTGEMSLIGPRPHMIGQLVAGRPLFQAANEYAARHRVKPGITGWAQVNGWRGPAETIEQIERRVEHDIFYIENWSLVLDFIILVKTILYGFRGKNAF